MNKRRDKFEKLEEIQQGLCYCYYNESTNDYHANVSHEDTHEWHTQFVNGAWYAFQERQDKIDSIKEKLTAIYDACDENTTVAILLDGIKECLE